jgi:chemotaxis protein methyltransferase CheR
MTDDGYLFLGGSETVIGVTEAFKRVEGHRGVYVPT